MDAKEDIRARLPIEQLVAQYCQLQKKGRNYVCLCPFHNDKKPSLLVSPDKGIAYCFACQSGGDIFSFFQRIENVDFPTALKLLAEKTGVELPKDRERPNAKVEKDAKERMRDCLDKAVEFFQARLRSTPAAAEYVKKRGVTEELMQTFGIGYAPDSFSETYDHLLKAGFSRSEIVGAGLGVQKELSEERIYDRFRQRIMFPIGDAQGRVIGFGGRAMGDADAKYVNSPDGPLYHKSTVLYGLHQAREAIRQSKSMLLVEGYFDVVAAHKAGVKNAVAVSGTALTEDHVKLIKRYADKVILCLDQDQAGQKAADRAFQLLVKENVAVLSITIPAKDPDELVQENPALFHDIVTTKTVPFLDGMLSQLIAMPDAAQPAGKERIRHKMFALIASLPDAAQQRAYLEKIGGPLSITMGEAERDFKNFLSGDLARKNTKELIDTGSFSRFELCIGIAIIHPRVRTILGELIPSEDQAWEKIRTVLAKAEDVPLDQILESAGADPVLKEKVGVLALYCEETFGLQADTLATRTLRKQCAESNRELMVRKQNEIVAELKEARKAGRADEEVRLLTKYQQVLKLAQMAK